MKSIYNIQISEVRNGLKNRSLFASFVLKVFLLIIFFVLLNDSICIAQQEAYESPAGTKFLLYTPPGYSASTTNFPLLLSLHSKGEVGDDLTELTSKNPEQMPSRLIYLNRWPQDLPFIVSELLT